jgi:hypothetical protein
MKSSRILLSVSLLALAASRLIFVPIVSAHCPLCVAGAGAGLTLSRLLGIDDSITGVWLAALLGATSFWSETLIKNKELRPKLRPLIYIGIFGLTIWSFYKFNLVIRMSQLFGLDKLIFGMIVGGVAFYLIDAIDDYIIKRSGKVFFPYQRIIVTLGGMLILSLGVYILINYFI